MLREETGIWKYSVWSDDRGDVSSGCCSSFNFNRLWVQKEKPLHVLDVSNDRDIVVFIIISHDPWWWWCLSIMRGTHVILISLSSSQLSSQLRRKENQSHLKADGDGNLFKHLLPLTLILGCISKARNLYAARRQFLIMFPFPSQGIWFVEGVSGQRYQFLSSFPIFHFSSFLANLSPSVCYFLVMDVVRNERLARTTHLSCGH